jgi:hypothetical protein
MNTTCALRNNVFLINFPKKLEVAGDIPLYYNLHYRKLPLSEHVLCRAQGIVVYVPNEDLDASSYRFFSKIYTVTADFIRVFENNPLESLDKLIGRERLVNPKQL